MKKITLIIFLFAASLFAQDDANVLSYFASDNSLDGQPRIDMMNVMRFFPVFAIQDSVKEVNLTIYYGGKIFDARADKMAGGKYWQTLLPEFHLGEAIQRVEAEMTFYMPYFYSKKLIEIVDSIKNLEYQIADQKKNDFINIARAVRKMIDDAKFNSSLKQDMIFNIISTSINLQIDFEKTNKDSLDAKIESILAYVPFVKTKNDSEKIKIAKDFSQIVKDPNYHGIVESIKTRNNSASKYKLFLDNKEEEQKNILAKLKDTALQKIIKEISGSFADTSFSGPAIRKSDLKISDDCKTASLLYRYYKNNLRYRKALDPAEHMGIFRARYVPFPVVGMPSDNIVRLLRPMQEKVPTVFEIGLSFGDDVVTGDNTLNPVFSLSRLGVAIVISEQLFKSDAEILGLALTYDFSSYASIGVGRNLAQGQSYPYYSFGINKKAFEQLLKAIAGLF